MYSYIFLSNTYLPRIFLQNWCSVPWTQKTTRILVYEPHESTAHIKIVLNIGKPTATFNHTSRPHAALYNPPRRCLRLNAHCARKIIDSLFNCIFNRILTIQTNLSMLRNTERFVFELSSDIVLESAEHRYFDLFGHRAFSGKAGKRIMSVSEYIHRYFHTRYTQTDVYLILLLVNKTLLQ